jgi:hypothetical protein
MGRELDVNVAISGEAVRECLKEIIWQTSKKAKMNRNNCCVLALSW